MLSLGEFLGFTGEEIEQAYFAKNKINHVRQETGY
jgi:dimeric dUTPase (all-alpha-NTP-PPase superfamily)